MGTAIFLTTGILNPSGGAPAAVEPWRMFLADHYSGEGAGEHSIDLYDRDRDNLRNGIDVYMERKGTVATDAWETLAKFEVPWPQYVLWDDRVDLVLFAKGGDGPGSNESLLRLQVTDGTGVSTGSATVLQVAETRSEVQVIIGFAPDGSNMVVTLEAFDNSASSNRLEARCTDRARALQFFARTHGT